MHRVAMRAFATLALFTNVAPCEEGWSDWIALFNGKNMDGWHLRDADRPLGCTVENGILVSKRSVDGKRSSYIVSDLQFLDFQLQVEYRVPKGSNAGLYLQGRYEIQIHDSYGRDPFSGMNGSLYRRITPKVNVSRPPGEWQTFDINFRAPRYDAEGKLAEHGRLTLIHNGEKTIDDEPFVGPTGSGWRDQYEGQPGPIVVQTDHGDVDFRTLRIRGLVGEPSFPKTAPKVVRLTAEAGKGPGGFGNGITVDWGTPNHLPAKGFRVYRGTTADFPTDVDHKVGEVRWWPPFVDGMFPEAAEYFYKVVPVGLDGELGDPAGPVSAHGEPSRADNLDLTKCGWAAATSRSGPVRRNKSYRNRTLEIAKKKYKAGFGVQAPSTIDFLVGDLLGDSGDFHLRGLVGLDEGVDKNMRYLSGVTFIVEADGKVLFDSGPMTHAQGAKELDVPVPAATELLRLRVDPGESNRWDHADWVNVRLEKHDQ